MGPLTLFLVAGEASGDRLGAALMEGLRTFAPGVRFAGIGGPLMQAEGLVSLFPMEDLSVMGVVEIAPKYFALKARMAQTVAAVTALRPDALITIDSPDFNLRVAALARKADPGLPTIHYVAPSVWAWRPGRAARMARVIDHVLALLPFEPRYMTAVGMTCDFVGHPVVAEPLASAKERAMFAGDGSLILALPGSRLSEVTRLAPVIGDVLAAVQHSLPLARVVLPTVRGVADAVRGLTRDWPIQPLIVEDASEKRGAFSAADAAIAASGTVSLELAANRVPMVIAYRPHPLTMWLMRRAALIDTVTLVNLVSETRCVPEFLGENCRADRIAPALLALLEDGPARAAQRAAMATTMKRLGYGSEAPGLRAARSVLAQLAQRPRQIQPPPRTRLLPGA